MLNRGSRGRFRPGMSRLGGGRPEGFTTEPRQDDLLVETPATMPRRLPASPIYTGGGPYEKKIPKPAPPKLLRDQLFDRMCDWEFHGLEDFASWMSEGQWITAMCDLVSRGFTFDRRGATLRLRKRDFNERKPMIVDLISGITLPLPDHFIGEKERPQSEKEEEQPEEVVIDFGLPDAELDPDDEMRLGEDDQLVISAPDMVTETVGILARKGSGKTYLGMVMAEEYLESPHNLHFAVLDPTGAWWGLGISEDGERPVAKDVIVFGGEHGHFRLRHDEGAKMARAVIELRPTPVILDLSKFSNDEQCEFGADFATELYRRNRDPIHLFIDEADAFAPQKLDKSLSHQRRSLSAMSTLVRRGRLRSVGITMITQRPAVINKDVSTQIGVMFFLQVTASHDKAAIGTWLDDNVSEDVSRACLKNLSSLGKGVAYFFQAGEDSRFCKFKVRAKRSYDSSLQKHPKHQRKDVPRMALSTTLCLQIEGSLTKAAEWVDKDETASPGTALAVVPPKNVDVVTHESEPERDLEPEPEFESELESQDERGEPDFSEDDEPGEES